MQDWYQTPALILTTLLLPAFGHLYLRSRDTRTLLWFLAFLFTVVRMFLVYPLGTWDFANGTHPWIAAAGQSCALLSSGLFLGSLSPLRVRIGKVQVLYVVPYIAPMIAYAFLAYGVFKGVAPQGAMFWVFPALAVLSFVVAFRWNVEKGNLPIWVGAFICLLLGGLAFWLCFRRDLFDPLLIAEAGNHIVTALLILFVFRRFSSGVALSFLGLMTWSLPILQRLPFIAADPISTVNVIRMVTMAKVVTALGLILLALETELELNKATGERERRARKELEAYTGLFLSRRRVEDFDRQAEDICRVVVRYSRFSQAALILLQPSGVYRLAGSCGLDPAVEKALDVLAPRIPVDDFPPKEFLPAVENSQTLHLDLQPWFSPGDDLERLRFTTVLAVPMRGRSTVEGAMLLTGVREGDALGPLRPDDLLPLEMFTARLQAVRSQTMMLEKLIDAEKFSGLGQLAGNVTQQLNNPLTVILGYASLLEDIPQLDGQARRGIDAILAEARHMRSTLQSLSRIARAPAGDRAAVSVTELLADMEHLHRSEFLQRSIEFRLNVAPALPRVLCHGQQLRQAVLHCLHFAMDAVAAVDGARDRSIRLEATSEGSRVQIMVSHSGPGFFHPERAFDPYVTPGGVEAANLGLSLCATILRDNHGSASAINLDPQGAAIVLDLQAA